MRRGGDGIRTRVNGFAGRCLAARPRHRVGFDPRGVTPSKRDPRTRADDETRTRDPNLGKVVRYQLRYIRISRSGCPEHVNDFSPLNRECKTGRTPRVSRRRFVAGPRHPVASVLGPFGSRAIGAVGSALPSHGRGHQFESGIAHQETPAAAGVFSSPRASPGRNTSSADWRA